MTTDILKVSTIFHTVPLDPFLLFLTSKSKYVINGHKKKQDAEHLALFLMTLTGNYFFTVVSTAAVSALTAVSTAAGAATTVS